MLKAKSPSQWSRSRPLLALLFLCACALLTVQMRTPVMSRSEVYPRIATLGPEVLVRSAELAPVPAQRSVAVREEVEDSHTLTAVSPAQAPRERLHYTFALKVQSEEGLLETSGTLVLVLSPGEVGRRLMEASVQGLLLHDGVTGLPALAQEVADTKVQFNLSKYGAVRDLVIAEGTNPEAARLWKLIVGRWQVSGNNVGAATWGATEVNEQGSARVSYHRRGQIWERRLLDYTDLEGAAGMPFSQSHGMATLCADDLPVSIEGMEHVRRSPSFSSESSLTYSYLRTRRAPTLTER
jgi:hypothetical protein